MPKELKAVAPQQVEFVEYDPPALGKGQIRVTSEAAAAKHGTEMAFFGGHGNARGDWNTEWEAFFKSDADQQFGPHGVGNMFVGSVTEVGPEVEGFAVGDRVAGYGSFRQVHTVNAAGCWKMPEGMAWQSAVCLDPADFAMAAVRDGNVRVGDAVAVFGMGAIGLMVVQIAKLAGATPAIAVEPLANRRAAAEKCGADLVLDPTAVDAGLEIRTATDKRGADVVIEYSGNVHALQASLRGVAFGGTVVAGAFPGPYGPGLDLGAEAHMNRPSIVFSRACSDPNRDHPRWDEGRVYRLCWQFLAEGRLTGVPVVDPVVAFKDLPGEYPKIRTAPESNIKLGCTF
jgi:threonine dehydrogenase-like Zn-dependent dehydrogenase